MPVSFVSSSLCTLKSFLIVQASPFSNSVSNFLNCLLSFRDHSLSVVKEIEAALLLSCFIYAQVIPSTKWRNAVDCQVKLTHFFVES